MKASIPRSTAHPGESVDPQVHRAVEGAVAGWPVRDAARHVHDAPDGSRIASGGSSGVVHPGSEAGKRVDL